MSVTEIPGSQFIAEQTAMSKMKHPVWAFGEMSELAEGARLEIACTTTKWYRGFESLSLRHL